MVDLVIQRKRSEDEEKRGGLGSTVDLILYRNRTNCEEKRWGWSERWICFTKEKRVFLRKKMGF